MCSRKNSTLIVLWFERIAQRRFGRIARDEALAPKLIGSALIVIGVALLYLTQV